ncbi:MAG: hypothetical protein RJB42_1327, partial [Bacteroidota bacterium]
AIPNPNNPYPKFHRQFFELVQKYDDEKSLSNSS